MSPKAFEHWLFATCTNVSEYFNHYAMDSHETFSNVQMYNDTQITQRQCYISGLGWPFATICNISTNYVASSICSIQLRQFVCLSNKDDIKIYMSFFSNLGKYNNKLIFFNKIFVKNENQETDIHVGEIVYQMHYTLEGLKVCLFSYIKTGCRV